MKQLLIIGAIVAALLLFKYGRATNESYIAPKNTAAPSSGSPTLSQTNKGTYRDGVYTGPVTDAYYGNVQVKATVANGKLSGVDFLQYPNDREKSVRINTEAMPMLISEAIQAQNGQVDIVSGATDTSNAFIQSLSSALSQAQ